MMQIHAHVCAYICANMRMFVHLYVPICADAHREFWRMAIPGPYQLSGPEMFYFLSICPPALVSKVLCPKLPNLNSRRKLKTKLL